MSHPEIAVVVEVLEKRFSLEEVTMQAFPPEIFKWELGGLTDPIGQLINWLWTSIQGAFSIVRTALEGALWTVRDYLYSAFQSIASGITSIVSGISSTLSTVYTFILQIPSTLSGLIAPISSAISTIGAGIASFGSVLSSIWSSIQGLGSQILSGVSGFFSTIQSWLSSAIASVSASISSFASTFSTYMSQVATSIAGIGSTIAGVVTSIVSSVSSSLQSLGASITSAITSAISGITSYLSGIANTLASSFSGITNYLSTFGTTVTQAFSGLQAFFTNIGQTLGSALSGLSNFLSTFSTQLWNSLVGIRDSLISSFKGISTSLTGLWEGIKSWVGDLPKWFEQTWTQVTTGLIQFGKTLTGFWQNVQAFFTEAYNKLSIGVREVMTTLGGFVNPLVNISNLFNQFVQSVVAFFKDPWGTLGKVLTDALKTVGIDLTPLAKAIQDLQVGFTNFLKDPWTALGKVLTDSLKSIGIDLTPLTKTFQDMWTGLQAFLKDPWGTLTKILGDWSKAFGFDKFLADLPKTLQGISKWLTEDLPKWFKEVGKGTEEWLKGLNVDWLNNIVKGISEFLKDPIGAIGNLFKGVIDWGQNTLFPMISDAVKGVVEWLSNVGKSVWDGIAGFAKGTFQWVSEGVISLIKWMSPKSPSIFDPIIEFFSQVMSEVLFAPFASIPAKVFAKSKDPSIPRETRMEATMLHLGSLMLQSVSFPYLISAFVRSLGDAINIGGGLGAEAGIPKATGKLAFRIDIKPAILLKHLARVFWKMPDILLGSLAYGYGIWITQPLMRVINAFKRNEMPIEMPNLEEIREITNRASLMETRDTIYAELTQFMAYYGYSDWTVSWNLGFYHDLANLIETEPSISVTDRFQASIEIPLALRHKLPSGSEFSRMMVRDLFATYEDFKEAMLIQGYGVDISRLYFLMHFRYPTMENLWEFIARMAAGFGWVTESAEPWEGMGLAGRSPSEISKAVSADPIAGLKALSSKILPYAKWHDYAPFAWQEDFTSDRLIMLDLMARLPDRIEGRWMYKWSIIDDVALRNLVVAEGFHPNFVENTAIAEAMNALTEERSSAKTGIVNLFEAGFMSKATVESRLSQIATVAILGKERTVKLLEGEKKLEVIRSLYDRAKNVLSGLWSNVRSGFTRNILTDEQALSIVVEVCGNVKSVLGLDLQVDETFVKMWIQSFAVRRDIDTIQRIRTLMRVFIYRASQLSEAGEDVATLIDEYVATAKLTVVEADIMKMLATAFIRANVKTKKLTIIKQLVAGRLKRGEINTQQAITELVNAGMAEDDARAWLEVQARFRTVSVDKLVSMAEYIPISQEILNQKMDAEGVPVNEQPLYRAYHVATDIAEEVGRLATEYVEDYVAGTFTLEQLTTNLNSLATMNGTVKETLGVEWIVLSPPERSLLITLAKMRKQRRVEPEDRVRGLTSATLVTMMEQVPISIEELRAKMTEEGFPTEDQKLRIAYALASQFGEEMGRLANEYVEDYVQALTDLAAFKTNLDNLATLNGTIQGQLGVEWIVLSPQERSLLVNLGMVRRQRKEAPKTKRKVLTTEKLISLMENVPVEPQKLVEKMELEGIPTDEQALMVPYSVATEINEEIGRVATEYVTDYANGVLRLADLEKSLNDLATLGGAVPDMLKVPWIVLSPLERQILVHLAKLRRARVLAKQAGVK